MLLDPNLKRQLDSLCRSRIEVARAKPADDFDRVTWNYSSSFDFWYGHVVGELFVQCYEIARQYYKENYGQGFTHAHNTAITALLAGHARDLRDALIRLKKYPITTET